MSGYELCPQCGNTPTQGHKLDCTYLADKHKANTGEELAACPSCGNERRNNAGYLMCECPYTDPDAVMPFSAQWIVSSVGSHPLWDQYGIVLYDLTTELPQNPAPVIHLDGATHEFFIYAMSRQDDKPPYPTGKIGHKAWIKAEYTAYFLTPANHGYQFKAESDMAAQERIQRLFDRVADGTINPDTDFRRDWNTLFKDGYPLVKAKELGEFFKAEPFSADKKA